MPGNDEAATPLERIQETSIVRPDMGPKHQTTEGARIRGLTIVKIDERCKIQVPVFYDAAKGAFELKGC